MGLRATVGFYLMELASNGTPNFTFNLFEYYTQRQAELQAPANISIDAVHSAVKKAL